ncbi:hypothetical protein KIPB_002205 [Kipferlia bialata]|uniref:Proteasome alpha-type subunits domain-containing protein n=1 Tax=Kipferlia bialata TaxID=797122 RepID=A0A9K3CR41_9EUKA|nr:hypothetical protein KIPB_002205 [Kipferlia bialata]|eukprot:g2205.t1
MESESAYSFSLTTFSPSGKLGQLGHAQRAVNNGRISIGVKATDGCVLCADKKVGTELIDITSVNVVEVRGLVCLCLSV